VLEVAVLDVVPGLAREFEVAFREAESILGGARGYRSHELLACTERDSRYLLLVRWDTLEDHTEGFRGSEAYGRWKELLHRFYDPFPEVEHYTPLGG